MRTTCLGAHALPPEFDGRADDYIDAVCAWLPALHAEGLVDAVDAFCERIAFTPAQTRRVFEAARALGLPVKLHAEQLSDQGGAALAAELGALSLRSPRIPERRRRRGDGARPARSRCCCPARSTSCARRKLPPVAALRAAGVPIAIATDHNPGSSPTLSLLLMLNMACTLFRLTPEEALRGVTRQRARARSACATAACWRAGQRADFVALGRRASERARLLVRPQPLPRASIAGGEERSAR